MKLNLMSKRTISSEGLLHTKMGVDEESADILTYYLRDKIYTNKILAPVREYICNAIDAHVEFGIDKDVEVKFGNLTGTWVWSVRDFGLGLDEDDIRNVFGKYGKSSKRDTEKQVGAFGVGAMSGFSYTDTFYVTSFHKGTKTSYICTLGAGDFGVSVG
jgi:HSP90 family molecular chaperone